MTIVNIIQETGTVTYIRWLGNIYLYLGRSASHPNLVSLNEAGWPKIQYSNVQICEADLESNFM